MERFRYPKVIYGLLRDIPALEANTKLFNIFCPTTKERDRIVEYFHKNLITHITTGEKTIDDYKRRVKKGIYTDDHLVLSLYGGDFFDISITDHNKYPTVSSNSILTN